RPLLEPRSARILQRRQVVVREQLGMVVGTPERFDPVRCQAVTLDTRSPGDLGIRDVANEQVSEDVFGLSSDRRSSFATDELSALETVEPLFDLASLETGDVRERARPEHPAHDG